VNCGVCDDGGKRHLELSGLEFAKQTIKVL
jgi:hypothetical protein